MTERTRQPTIRDVAERAGVSTASVSRVLAGAGRPRAATDAAVRAAVAELGYRPSSIARSLRTRRTGTFGLLVSEVQNPFFPALVDSVADAARGLGRSVVLGTVAGDGLADLERMLERSVDGLIVAWGRLSPVTWRWIAEAPIPIVVVNSEPDGVAVPIVVSDTYAGTREAVGHLVGLGHRRIGYLRGPADSPTTGVRLAGFVAGCAAAGIAREATPVVDGSTVEDAESATRRLLVANPTLTAVATYNDLAAIGAIRAVHGLGGRVPEDVSVVGFDDIPAASWVTPPLTTVAQAKRELGRIAAERLVSLVTGERPFAGRDRELVRVPTELVVRGSTAAPRRGSWRPR